MDFTKKAIKTFFVDLFFGFLCVEAVYVYLQVSGRGGVDSD